MDNVYLTLIILIVVFLGISALGKEMIQHKKQLSKSEFRWKFALLMLGIYLFIVKFLKLITIINHN